MSLDQKFHHSIVELGLALRRYLQSFDETHRMDFTIEIEGRVHDGDLLLKYAIGEYGSDVKGDSIDAVLEEWLRRNNWNKRHTPLCLPNVEEPVKIEATAEEETF